MFHHVPSFPGFLHHFPTLFTCFPTCFPTCPNGVSHVENQRPGSHGRCALQLGAGEEAEAPRHVETLHRAFEDLPNFKSRGSIRGCHGTVMGDVVGKWKNCNFHGISL